MCARLNRGSLLTLLTLSVRELFVTLIRTSIITESTNLVVLLAVFLTNLTLSRLLALLSDIARLLLLNFRYLVLLRHLLPLAALNLLLMRSLIVSLPVRAFPAMWRETRPLLDLIGGATRKMKFYV